MLLIFALASEGCVLHRSLPLGAASPFQREPYDCVHAPDDVQKECKVDEKEVK